MKIRINQCPNGEWYRDRIGQILSVYRWELCRHPGQGIPENVYWCREGGAYNCMNYVRVSDATVVTETSDTPRTDAHLKALHDEGAYTDPTAVSAEFARELEQENSRLRGILSRLLEQADEVHRFSSWTGMCEYTGSADAREEARIAVTLENGAQEFEQLHGTPPPSPSNKSDEPRR